MAVLIFPSTPLLVFETGSLAPNLRPSSPWGPPVSAHSPLQPWSSRIALQAQMTLFIHHSALLSPRCLDPGIPLCH